MNTHRLLAGCALILSVFLVQGWGSVAVGDAVRQEAEGEPPITGSVASGQVFFDLAQTDSSLGVWECWTPPGTVPCNHHLYAIDALSETDAWAAGEAGTIVHWDGQSWQPVPTPTLANLHAIDMLSPTQGWAAGSGVALRWDGVAWSEVSNPMGSAMTSLSMVSPTDGWGVGSSTYSIMRWDGAAWTRFSSSSGRLYGVSMASETDGWAVGGWFYEPANAAEPVAVRWNGQEWRGVDVPVASWDWEYLTDVDVVAADDIWVVGGGYFWQTGSSFATILHWDGQGWTRLPTPISAHLHAVSMLSPTDGWALGGSSILRWDGAVWKMTPNPINRKLNAMVGVSPTLAWAVADNGFTLQWNGTTWTVQIQPMASASGRLNAVDMLSPDDGWAVGGPPGRIVHWDGESWQKTATPLTFPLTETLHAVDMVAIDDGWAVGGGFSYSGGGAYSIILHWDGLAWTLLPATPGGALTSLSMVADDDGWAVGENTMLHWDGATWTRAPSPRCPLNAVAMVSADDGWAVGAHGCILRWNGSNWAPLFSPTWLDLSSVAMLTAQDGWALGDGNAFVHWDGRAWANMNAALIGQGNSLAMLATDDVWSVGIGIQHWDGRAWSSAHSPTARALAGVAMTSSSDGWAVGNGVILRYSGPTPSAQVFLPLVTLEQEVRHANER